MIEQLQRDFQGGFNRTQAELAGILPEDRGRAAAHLQGLLGYAARRMDPEVAQRWLDRGYGRDLESDVHEVLGVEREPLGPSVDEHLRAARGPVDHGFGL